MSITIERSYMGHSDIPYEYAVSQVKKLQP